MWRGFFLIDSVTCMRYALKRKRLRAERIIINLFKRITFFRNHETSEASNWEERIINTEKYVLEQTWNRSNEIHHLSS